MAELHCFGCLLGSDEDFEETNLFARWKITHGPNWEVIEGYSSGDTQIDFPSIGNRSFWSHPIDVHFTCNGVQNWPRFEIQVFKEDAYGRVSFISYGFVHIPSQPGYHELKCYTWKPVGTIYNRLYSLFTNSNLILRNSEIIYNSAERYRLRTETSGSVDLQLYIIAKNFDQYGVELS